MNVFHIIQNLEERMFTEALFRELCAECDRDYEKQTLELTDEEISDAYRVLQEELDAARMAEFQKLEELSIEYARLMVPVAFRQGQFTGFQQYFVDDTSKTPYTDFSDRRRMRAPYAMSIRETFAADRLKEAYDRLHNNLSEYLQRQLQNVSIIWEYRIDSVMRHSFFLGYYHAHMIVDLVERKGPSTMRIIEKKLLTEYDLKLLQLREYAE